MTTTEKLKTKDVQQIFQRIMMIYLSYHQSTASKIFLKKLTVKSNKNLSR